MIHWFWPRAALDRASGSVHHQNMICKRVGAPRPVHNQLASETRMADLNHLPAQWTINRRLASHGFIKVAVREIDLSHLKPLSHDFDKIAHVVRVLSEYPHA